MPFSEIPIPALPDMDFEYTMNVRISPYDWFDLSKPSESVLSQKQEVVNSDQISRAIFFTPESEAPFAEMMSLMGINLPPNRDGAVALTQMWEPDFVFMQRNEDQDPVMIGASLCMPSSWNPSEKIGHKISEIHSIVPGLNAKIGEGIKRFLSHAKSGMTYERWFWGVAATPQLYMHPEKGYPRLSETTLIESIYIRIEHQGFIHLPDSDTVLFMIRPIPILLTEFISSPENATALIRQLATIPSESRLYKSIPESLLKTLREE